MYVLSYCKEVIRNGQTVFEDHYEVIETEENAMAIYNHMIANDDGSLYTMQVSKVIVSTDPHHLD